MAARSLPDIDYLRKCFEADFDRGLLTWKVRPKEHFPDERAQKIWNTRFSGTTPTCTAHGYVCLALDYRSNKAHRIIWAMAHGRWPNEIDHINGEKADNRLTNLREVTHQENQCNRKTDKDNKSGVMGVGWHKVRAKWRADIKVNGKHFHLGYFDNISDAVLARIEGENRYGFHPNHGR